MASRSQCADPGCSRCLFVLRSSPERTRDPNIGRSHSRCSLNCKRPTGGRPGDHFRSDVLGQSPCVLARRKLCRMRSDATSWHEHEDRDDSWNDGSSESHHLESVDEDAMHQGSDRLAVTVKRPRTWRNLSRPWPTLHSWFRRPSTQWERGQEKQSVALTLLRARVCDVVG